MAHPRPDVLEFALQHKPTVPAYPSHKGRLVEEAGGVCVMCGYAYTGSNGHHFDFHHREPGMKRAHVACLARCSLERARTEASKCDLLCKLCHTDRHVNSSKPRRNPRLT